MKRALVFLVAAPVLVAATAFLFFLQLNGLAELGAARFLAMILFLFTLPVSVITGALDEYLARAFPVLLRVPMAAAIGAIVAAGLAFILFGDLLLPSSLPFFALGGAVWMGVCSLLANDYARAPLLDVRGNSLLRNG
jgi:hypothetical protein